MSNSTNNENKKEKKPVYKRVWFWIVAVVIVIAASIHGGEDTTNQTKQSATPSSTEQKVQPAQAEKPKYEILEQKITKEQYVRYVAGKIKNNSGTERGYLQVEINLYDKDNNQVGSTLANVNNLEKDGIWTFKAPILEDEATSYKIKDVTGF